MTFRIKKIYYKAMALIFFPVLLSVYHFYSRFNSFIIIEKLQSASVTELIFTNEQENVHFWNPSLVLYKNPDRPDDLNRYLVAVRESSRSQCGGIFGFIDVLFDLYQRATSSVVIGSVHELNMGQRGSKTIIKEWTRLDNFIHFNGPYHLGREDPKWILDPGLGVYIQSNAEIMGNSHIFLTKFEPETGEIGSTFMIKDIFKGVMEKNWMYIPMKHKPQNFQNYIKMIYSLDPLQTVWVDPNTGEVEDRTDVTTKLQSSGKTLGTSALIPFSFNGTLDGTDRYFIGICHSKKYTEMVPKIMTDYTSRFFIIELNEQGDIISMNFSRFISYPVTLRPSRLQYPTTITESNDAFLVSIGDMDCTSHVIAFEKEEIKNLFQVL